MLKSTNPPAEIEVVELDISSLESIDGFLAWVKGSNRKIDVLINNAAVLIREWTIEALDQCFQTVTHN